MTTTTNGVSPPDPTATARLLSPRSIAIVGASERSRWSSAIVANLDRHGYQGVLHLVNPRGGVLGDRPVATSVQALDEPVDLAVVLVPAAGVVDVVGALGDVGARAAMILTSGFAETGGEGHDRQASLVQAARAGGVRLLGPNSLGFMNFVDGTVAWATPIDPVRAGGGLAVVSQSGATAFFLARMAAEQHIALSHVVSTGNEADLDGSTFARALAESPDTTAVAMFIESVRHPDRFVLAAEAADRAGKPLVVLKVGASEVSARSALAHTGALVGDDRVFAGVCERHGVIRVRSLEELMTTADIVGRTGPLRAGGLCVVTNSGGVCEIAADSAHQLDIDLPPVPEVAREVLAARMPAYATPHNPLDLTGGIVPEDCEQIVGALADADEYAAVLVPFYPVPDHADDDRRLADLHRHLSAALNRSATPGFLVSYTSVTVTDGAAHRISEEDLPYLACGMDRALVGLGHALWWSARRRRPEALRRAIPLPPKTVTDRPTSESGVLDLLARHGVPVPPRRLATRAADAVEAAGTWGGLVALKVSSPDIAHKTEIGGVALDVSGSEAITAAFDRVLAAGRSVPGARIDGVAVSPMRTDGVELFVGCSQDPVWGPVIALGLGGIWVEVFADASVRPLPVTVPDVSDMLNGLRGARLLHGERGRPPADLEHLAAIVAAIGDLALALGNDLAALDVNPLWVRGGQIEALDGLAVWA